MMMMMMMMNRVRLVLGVVLLGMRWNEHYFKLIISCILLYANAV